jgi:DNA-binding NarL/FixJ family response regulator
MQNVTRVLLVSRHRLIAEGLKVLLQSRREFSVVGEISDNATVIRAAQIDADVIILDLIAQALNGLSIIRQLKARAPESSIVVLAMCAEESYVSHALQNGASGYVLKSENFAALACAVRAVISGRQYISPSLNADAIRERVASGGCADKFESLTARERQVLHLTAQGCTSARIAVQLSISPRTAEAHRANIYKKLDFASHAELVVFALRRGLLTRDI